MKFLDTQKDLEIFIYTDPIVFIDLKIKEIKEHNTQKIKEISSLCQKALKDGYEDITPEKFEQLTQDFYTATQESIHLPSSQIDLNNYTNCLLYQIHRHRKIESYDYWLDCNSYTLKTVDVRIFKLGEISHASFESTQELLENMKEIIEDKLSKGFTLIIGDDRSQLQKDLEKAEQAD